MADKNLLQWDSLRQRLGLGARANKYLVEIVPPRGGEVAVAGQSNVDLSDPGKIVAFCKGTSIPSREMGIAEVWIQGRKIPIPGDAQFAGTWDLTFYNDQAHDLRKQFEIWIENLDSYAQHQRGFDATQYFADQFKVHQLDPKDQTTELASWEFYHCFPSAISAVDFGADTNDTVTEFTITLTYGHYNRIK